MANHFSRGRVSSGIRIFLLFTFVVSYLQRAEVRAGSTEQDDEAIDDFRPVNFDEKKWISPKSAKTASSMDSTEETLEDEEFDRLLRRSHEDRQELKSSFFPRKRSEEIFYKNFNDLFDLEDDSAKSDGTRRSEDDPLTILRERPVVLPARFIQVAREFYRSLVIPIETRSSFMRNSETDRKEGDENSVVKPPGLSWRNIIDAPTGDCPPGERKDRNGRCRMTLW